MRRMPLSFAASWIALLALAGCGSMHELHHEANAPIVMEEFMVPASEAGIELYVRNKHPAGMTSVKGERVVLFVHGATYPSETTFDVPLNGMSWMDYIARRGYDVYLVDARGYGRSTRPKEMDEPADNNPPIVRTETASRDVASAVEFIRKRRGVEKINLLGWSWGTSIMGLYATRNNDKVNKLVLYAVQWLRDAPSLTDTGGKLGAYRTVPRDAVKGRWLNGVAEDKKADLAPAGWLDAWADASFATDPKGGGKTLRAPNGIVLDNREYWGAGKMLYDPSLIRVPTLIAHGEWDADVPSYMTYGYFAKLTNAPYRRFVQIGEGTHSVMLEKNRMQLFQAVQQFLDEDGRPGQ